MGQSIEQRDDAEGYMAIVAHELRAPLSAIMLAGGTLQRAAQFGAPTPSDLTAILDVIDRQGRRMGRLLDHLLIAARIDHDLVDIELVPEPVRPILVDVAGATPSNGQPVIVDCDADLTALTDAYLLRRAVASLVANATIHGGPPVVLTALRSRSTISITVRDHGPGVPPAAVDSLFARFSDVASGRADRNGVGLSIVRDLVSAVRGAVAYEDADPGALFTVNVPPAPRVVVDGER